MANDNKDFSKTSENTSPKRKNFVKHRELNIAQKIGILLGAFSFTAIFIVGLISYISSKKTLKDYAFNQLNSVAEFKKISIEDYFSLVRNQVKVLAQNKMMIDAMNSFEQAFEVVDIDTNSIYYSENLDNIKMNIKNYYNTSFITPLNNYLNKNYTADAFLSDNRKTNILQYIYISNNPNPYEAKSLLSRTADGGSYSKIHSNYHPNIRDYAEKFGIEDIYLIDVRDGNDPRNGNVVYSVSKKVDFAVNLNKVPYKNSGLPLVYEEVQNSNVRDFSYMTDMSLYEPSLGLPSVFIAAPIYSESKRIGILAFQISGNKINDIVSGNKQWERQGLKKTGETYIIGDDLLMRSDNRLIYTDKNKYLESVRLTGMTDAEISQINNLNSCILTMKVNTEAANEAINGRTENKSTRNYLNKKVLSSYAPLDLENVNWAIVCEIEVSEVLKPTRSLRNIIFIVGLILISLVNFIGRHFYMSIANRLNNMKDSIHKLALGLTISKFQDSYNDEVGMTEVEINSLVDRLDEVSNFANAIGKGDFSFEYKTSSENDKLGNSLLGMKESLEVARKEEEKRLVEDEKRNWSTQGIAKFGEILRSNNDNLDKLSYDIISNLVDYLHANQGGLFLLEGEDEEDKHINLVASYAFNRQKFIKKRIELGEGLVGTCVLEKKTIHIIDIPDDYINITSGLGDANPNAILIVPLKTDDNVLGVLEIATFDKFEEHEIDFVEKLADSIASTVTSVRINAKTALLLRESNEKANALAQQEEEMRQNIEELKATQEEMARLKKEEEMKENERKEAEQVMMDHMRDQNEKMKVQAEEMQQEKNLMDAILNNLPDLLYFKDKDGKFVKNSLSHAKINGFENAEQMKGKTDFDLFPEVMAQKKFDDEQEIINSGKGFIDKIELDKNSDGVDVWLSTTKLPLFNDEGECIGTFGISKNVNELKKLELEAKSRNDELEAQEEEMRQNMEEMQTIQEEVSKRSNLIDALLKYLPDNIYFKDENGVFMDCSDSMCEFLGFSSKSDVIGKSDMDIFNEAYAKMTIEEDKNIIKTGTPILNKIEKEILKDGKEIIVSISKMPLKDEFGRTVGTFGISTDVTRIKKLENELEEIKGATPHLEKLQKTKKELEDIRKSKKK